MKYDITLEDRQTMERDMKNDRTLKHLRNLSFYKFTIGDVLVREDKYLKYDGTKDFNWQIKMADCNLPYKYTYVFENELGVGYIRRLSVNGRKFVERSICVTEFDPDITRFMLDPEYADHMLLAAEGEDFDTKSRYAEVKKKREQIHRKNKKNAINMPDAAAIMAWLSTLKIGDQIWYGWSINNISKDPYFVTEINLSASMNLPAIRVSNVLRGLHTRTISEPNLRRGYVFMQRPLFFEDVIN